MERRVEETMRRKKGELKTKMKIKAETKREEAVIKRRDKRGVYAR